MSPRRVLEVVCLIHRRFYHGFTIVTARQTDAERDSRVRLRKHYSHDVVAGAALGILTAEVETRQPRGLLIAPFYRPDGRARGLTLGTRF